jgi:hypothetical protein
MDVERLYSVYVIVVSVAWLLLIVAPRWVWTERIVHRVWMPVAVGLWILALSLLRTDAPSGAGMTSMKAVMLLTNGPEGTLILWTLVMGWDLFAGAWLSRDALRRGIHHAWVIPSLLATYFIGIHGLLLYFAIRLVLRKATTLEEAGGTRSGAT